AGAGHEAARGHRGDPGGQGIADPGPGRRGHDDVVRQGDRQPRRGLNGRQRRGSTGRFGAPFRFRNAVIPPTGIDSGPAASHNLESFHPDKAMQVRPSAVALTPSLLFLALFFGAAMWFTLQGDAMGFYQLRAPVAILPALALAA